MISACKFCIKTIHSSATMNNLKNFETQSRMLRKLLNKGLSKRKNPQKLSGKMSPEASALFMDSFDRRKAVFNKVYMEHITQVMQSGRNSEKLLGLGIEISKVQILSGLKHINVYWISKGETSIDEKIEEALKSASSELQKEINSLRYVGKSPEIRFIRDLTFENEIEVHKLLAKADFGKDFKPSQPPASPFDPTAGDINLEMDQDILGVNHAKISEKILMEKKKHKNINELPDSFEIKDSGNVNYGSEKLIKFDKKLFLKYYYKKRIEILKENKRFSAMNFNKYLMEETEENEEWAFEEPYTENDVIEYYINDNDIYDENLKEPEDINDSNR